MQPISDGHKALVQGEQDLRRKNWLVAGREPAKRLVPMIMSKLLPPKLRKHEPWNSLEVLLAVLASHPESGAASL